MKQKLICILGETASGKDSLLDLALHFLNDPSIHIVCSYADRPKREGETDGVEHYFISTEEFNKLKDEKENEIVAYTKIEKDGVGYQYMALLDEVKQSHIYIIDPNGLKYLNEHFSEYFDIIPVYIYASLEIRMNRAKIRSDFDEAFENRVIAERDQFKEFDENKLWRYKVINEDDILKAANHLKLILSFELYDRHFYYNRH